MSKHTILEDLEILKTELSHTKNTAKLLSKRLEADMAKNACDVEPNIDWSDQLSVTYLNGEAIGENYHASVYTMDMDKNTVAVRITYSMGGVIRTHMADVNRLTGEFISPDFEGLVISNPCKQ